MELKQYSPIARLFLKHLAGKLNPEEQKLLNDWVNRSERNRAYFLKWCDEQQQEQLLEKIAAYDAAADWQTVVRKTNRRKYLRRAIAAASVILLIGGLGILRYAQEAPAPPVPLAQETTIQPGKRLASLITSSGETVQLDTLQHTEVDNLKVCRQEGTFILQNTGQANKNNTPEYHCVDVPEGGEFSFRLPDGTEIFLNAGSRLRFPEYFIPGKERRVYLSGEAYFDVARDTASPFLVCLEHTTIKVLGTSFNVTAYPEEGREITTLVRGSVSMKQKTSGKKFILTPGQQGNYDISKQTLTQQQVDVSYYTSWKNGVFAFDKQPVEQVMKILSRWYLFKIRYTEPTLKSILYTGKIARHASIQEVLHTFELLDELRFEVRGKEIIVSRK